MTTKDPYKYYRIEARELLQGLAQGALDLEKGQGGTDTLIRLLRLAHTLKGASRVVKVADIAELAHAMEDVLAPFRGGAAPVSREALATVLRQVDAAEQKLRDLGAPAPTPAPAPEAKPAPPTMARRADDGFETVRVEIPEMDEFLGSVTEAGIRISSLRSGLRKVHRARALLRTLQDVSGMESAAKRIAAVEELSAELHAAERFLTDDIEQAETRIARIQDRAERLRLVPASAIFPILERAVRDAAESVRKPVRFISAGGDHRLDAYVLRILRDALLHVVRNGVAHGIEPEAGRAAAGKPREGTIQVSVERRGSRLAIVCSDDGCGIDVEAVRAAAVRQGVLAPAAAARVGLQEAVQLLLRGGLTTTGAVTELSGRGIGLDVLRDAVARLKGELFVRSDRGRGTAIEVVVPMSVSSQAVLQVDAGGVRVALPLDAVVSNVLLRPEDVVRSADRDSIRHGGALIPLTPLSGLLSRPAPAPTGSFSAVIVRAGGQEAAIRVDRPGEITRVMVRPIPASAQADPVVLGACLDAGGTPQLVLDPRSVIDGARRAAPSATPEATREGSPILIIDDSLTTRMLEQSILESAGFQVDLAVSGEDGLAKARDRRYGLFICDVEMPGMNGFEFVTRAKADATLKDIPSILVTSLASPEDKSRGKRAGARAYIVKSEFDQGPFLNIVRELLT